MNQSPQPDRLSTLGGRGSYVGTFAGALFITLLSSILSILQMPEGARQITYGVIIILMMLLHRARNGS